MQQAGQLRIFTSVKPVHHPVKPGCGRNSTTDREYPLSEMDMPMRNPNDTVMQKVDAMYAILDFLDVENSKRYALQGESTFCGVYIYDFCYLANAYLPLMWWSDEALDALRSGKAVNANYGANLVELNGNKTFDWLMQWGAAFGWTKINDVDALQQMANAGRVAIICANRLGEGTNGHIVSIIPEKDGNEAMRENGIVVYPLQTHAGIYNKKLSANDWFVKRKDSFHDIGFWYHE